MSRKSIGRKERGRLFLLHGGVCHICGGKITCPPEAWEVSHIIPLAIGGDDDDVNRMPAHKKCHRHRTSTQDIPLIAKVKRIRAGHDGTKAPSARPFRTNRDQPWKKKLNGELVRRDLSATVVKAYRP